jgi:hypothetical protein
MKKFDGLTDDQANSLKLQLALVRTIGAKHGLTQAWTNKLADPTKRTLKLYAYLPKKGQTNAKNNKVVTEVKKQLHRAGFNVAVRGNLKHESRASLIFELQAK